MGLCSWLRHWATPSKEPSYAACCKTFITRVLCPSLAFLDISINLIPEQCLIGIREACANNQIELVGDQQLEQVARPPQMVEANMSQMALGLHRAMQREDEGRELLRRRMGGEAGNPDQPHIDCVTVRFAAAVHFPPT